MSFNLYSFQTVQESKAEEEEGSDIRGHQEISSERQTDEKTGWCEGTHEGGGSQDEEGQSKTQSQLPQDQREEGKRREEVKTLLR